MSTDDLPLFAAAKARAQGIEAADDHASIRWREAASKAVRLCADILPDFTADDCWEVLEKGGADPIETERHPAALGPIILAFARSDFIEKTGEMRRSRFTRRHRDLTVWRKAA